VDVLGIVGGVQRSLSATDTVVALSSGRNVVDMLFYVVAGVLAVLTYLNARRTFFQPRHTEVFKLVTQQCVEIASLLCGKNETQLLIEIHYDTMVLANTHVLLDHYAHLTFGFEPPDPYERIDEFGEFKRRSTLHKTGHVVAPKAYSSADESEVEVAEMTGWNDLGTELVMPLVFVPDEMHEHWRTLDSMRKSILTPDRVKPALDCYCEACEDLPSVLMDVLNDIAPTLPESYSTLEALELADHLSVMNEFNRRRPRLEPLLDDVCQALRRYLDVERVFR
jgi:hypothetical protein